MPSSEAPLPTAAIHILVAIGSATRHGYSIMTEVASSTSGAVKLAPGTLYTNIQRLLNAGLIEEAKPTGIERSEGPRRRYYRLTTAGRQVVAAEVTRMEGLVTRARQWLQEPP